MDVKGIFSMKLTRILFVVLLLALVLPLSAQDATPEAMAEETASDLLILPVNRAEFIPGARFDFRVEVHGVRALPSDFAVTVNGEDAAAVFEGAEGMEEAWEFGGRVSTYVAEGTPAADFSATALSNSYYNSAFGEATVELTEAGTGTATVAGETATLEPTDDPLVFNVVGGQADGQAVTFGLNAEGAVTGFQILGQNFGVLTTLPTPVVSMIWRGVEAPASGEYTVELTAGGLTESVTWTVREAVAGEARNVILFIADGMRVPMITAARLASRGLSDGKLNGEFAMDQFEEIGLVHTNSIDSIMMDSANTASSMNTGHKGSVNATGTYSDTSPSRLDDPRVETFAQMIKRTRGMSVGIVTTSDFTDATPAAVWAHGRDRSSANRAAFAIQALEFQPEVILGGGQQYLLPQSTEGSTRGDDRNLVEEFQEAGYTYVTTATELEAALAETPERLIGMFHARDMNVYLDRTVYTDNLGDFTDQPGLVDMTLAALEVLNQNENGFYLEVEAASVDKQMHPLDQERALSDLIEFDNAVAAAVAWTQENAPDTLIVVTADHGHGYDVYGTVDTTRFNAAEDDLGRRAAILVYNAAGFPTYTDEDGDGVPNWETEIVFAGVVNNGPEHTEDYQVSATPRVPAVRNEEGVYVDNPDDDPNGILFSGNLGPGDSTGVHTLQDVPLFATGPGAEYFGMVMEQNEIFYGMVEAIGLDLTAEAGSAAIESGTETTAVVIGSGLNLTGSLAGMVMLVIGLLAGVAVGRRR